MNDPLSLVDTARSSPAIKARMLDADVPAAVRDAAATANDTNDTADSTDSASGPASDTLARLATLLGAASVADAHFPGTSLGLDLIPYGITYTNDKGKSLYYGTSYPLSSPYLAPV